MPTSYNPQDHTPPPLPPLSCPQCGSKKIKKKGKRHTRYEDRQRYGCNKCGHTFIREVTEHARYPFKLSMESISFYNPGYSARQTTGYLRRRFGIKVPEKTFRHWYTTNTSVLTYHQLRSHIKQRYAPRELVKTFCLEHRQVYIYQIHYGKLDALFNEAQGEHSSQYPVFLKAQVTRKENDATKLAALALQIAPSNKKRHEAVQRFMLLNDSATLATEIPLYPTPADFAVLQSQGFTFPFGEQPRTGHIDLVQFRGGFLHILDYKREASKEKHVVTQFTIYALALSQRTGIPVKAFKCAWFDEEDYFEFFPLPAVYP